MTDDASADYAVKLLRRELRLLWMTRDALILAAAKRYDVKIIHEPHHNDEIRSLARALRVLRDSRRPKNRSGDVWVDPITGERIRVTEVHLHRGVEHLVVSGAVGFTSATEQSLTRSGYRRVRASSRP